MGAPMGPPPSQSRQHAASIALEGARAARTRPEDARKAIDAALALAPDDVDVRMAAYKFHFYNHDYAPAADHAAVCIRMFAADLGLPPDWRSVAPDHADFAALARAPGRYLQALIAWGYCRARLGAVEEGREAVAQAARLDPNDRFGARRLLAVMERGGVEIDAYAVDN